MAGSTGGVMVGDSSVGAGEALAPKGVRVGTGNGVAGGVQETKNITASPTLTKARLAA